VLVDDARLPGRDVVRVDLREGHLLVVLAVAALVVVPDRDGDRRVRRADRWGCVLLDVLDIDRDGRLLLPRARRRGTRTAVEQRAAENDGSEKDGERGAVLLHERGLR